MSTPQIDVIIAVHDPARPVARAVSAVRAGAEDLVRVSVVVHNTDPAPIAEAVAGIPDVRILSCMDSIPSPSGPMNAGLDAADAPWVSVIGSDDTVEHGAYARWLALASHRGADVILPRVRFSAGGVVPTPPTRPFRTRDLDGVRDRLSYRAAPLGLLSRQRVGSLRFPPGLRTGEDIPFTADLWFSGARISYAASAPSYVVHDDASSRVTRTARPLADEFAWLIPLERDVAPRATAAQRRALGAKLLRINLFGAVWLRRGQWTPDERTSLADIAGRLQEYGAGVHRSLARHDQHLLALSRDPHAPDAELDAAADRRRRFLSPGGLIPRAPGRALDREAPLRVGIATALRRF